MNTWIYARPAELEVQIYREYLSKSCYDIGKSIDSRLLQQKLTVAQASTAISRPTGGTWSSGTLKFCGASAKPMLGRDVRLNPS